MVVENQNLDRDAVIQVFEILSACASAMRELNVAITKSSTRRIDEIDDSIDKDDDLLFIRSNISLVFDSFDTVRYALEQIVSKQQGGYEIGLTDGFKMIGLLMLDIVRDMVGLMSFKQSRNDQYLILVNLGVMLAKLNRIITVEYRLWNETPPTVRITPFVTIVSNILGSDARSSSLQTSHRERLDWDKSFLESIRLGDARILKLKQSQSPAEFSSTNTWSVYILTLSKLVNNKFKAQRELFESGDYADYTTISSARRLSSRTKSRSSSSTNAAPTNPNVMVGLMWFVRETFNKTDTFMNDFRKTDIAYRVSIAANAANKKKSVTSVTVAPLSPSENPRLVVTKFEGKDTIGVNQPPPPNDFNQPPPNAKNDTPFLYGEEYQKFLRTDIAPGLITVKQIYDIVIDNVVHIKQFKLRADQVDGFKIALRVCCSWMKWSSYTLKTMSNPQWQYYASEDIQRGIERAHACLIYMQNILRSSLSGGGSVAQSISSNSKTISDLIGIISKDESLPQRDQALNPFVNDNPREYEAFIKVFDMALKNSRSIDSMSRLFAIYSSSAFYVALRPAELYLLRNLHLKRFLFPLRPKRNSGGDGGGDEGDAELDENGESNEVSNDENSMQGMVSRMFGAVGGFAKRHSVKILVILVSILAAGAVTCVYYPDAFKQMIDWMRYWIGDSVSSAIAASWTQISGIFDKAKASILAFIDSLSGYDRALASHAQNQTRLDDEFLNRTANIPTNTTQYQNLLNDKIQASQEIRDDFISDTQKLRRVLEDLQKEEFDPLRLDLDTNRGAYVSGVESGTANATVDPFLNQYHDTYTYVNDASNIVNETYSTLGGIANGTRTKTGTYSGTGFGANTEFQFQPPGDAIGTATKELIDWARGWLTDVRDTAVTLGVGYFVFKGYSRIRK